MNLKERGFRVAVINELFVEVAGEIIPSEVHLGVFEVDQDELPFVLVHDHRIVFLEVVMREDKVAISSLSGANRSI